MSVNVFTATPTYTITNSPDVWKTEQEEEEEDIDHEYTAWKLHSM